ncbi:BTAD domain-containing putative transcriptional regulator [Micromonospora sp. NPDC049274]|uniref:AfsR/SARP family transcriptional regulator n=1 Tax=Micromonospora sp. NPDC049274 TaxID=3154829 RepID=UPI00343A18B6
MEQEIALSKSAGARRADDGVRPVGGGLRFQILGPLRFWRDGVEVNAGPRQQCRLLALLLARAGRPISVHTLIELLWGEEAPASAVNVIHKYVGTLRRLMEPSLPPRATGSYLRRHGGGYLFAPGPGTLDLVTFRELTGTARASLAVRDRDEALDRYVEALELWRGPAGDSYASGTAATPIFTALDREFLAACVSAAELAVSLSRPAVVLHHLRLAASMAPLNEPVQASLIAALGAAGHQAEALETFRSVRSRLADDLGIDPGSALEAAHLQVLTQTAPPVTGNGAGDGDPRPSMPLVSMPLVRPAQLPPDLPAFVGRTAELATLAGLHGGRADAGRTGPLIVALDGMGGVGKSTLAGHFAHLVARDFTDGQLYLDLRGDQAESDSLSASDALGSLLSSQGFHMSSVPETLAARVGIYRSLTAGKSLLLLLDNARDAAQVRALLPNSPACLVLVTSRKPLVELAALDGARLLHLDPPDMPTARELIQRRLEHAPNRSLRASASPVGVLDEIIELCGRLPLAMAILAGRLSARPRLALADVAAELRDGTRRLAAFASSHGGCDPRAAFAWSYRQLSPQAARVFRLSSAAMAPGISAEALASMAETPPRVARAMLRELADAAMLDEDDEGRFTSHVLIRAYALELLLAEEPDRDAAVSRLLQHYLHSSYHAATRLAPMSPTIVPTPAPDGVVVGRPGSYDEAMRWFEDHREVLPEAVRRAAEGAFGVSPWQLALAIVPWFQLTGRFHDWQDMMRVALRSARDSGDEVGAAHAMRGLADSCYYFANYDEALDLLSRARETFAEHGMIPELGDVHAAAQRIHGQLGQHERALAENERALSLYRAAGIEHGEIRAAAARGRSLVRLGALGEAMSCLTEALARSEKSDRRTDEPAIRIVIAECLGLLGCQRQARDQLEQAVEAAVESQSRIGVFEASALLCAALLDLDDVPGACRAWRRACDAMHAMQNGGTRTMRDEVCDLGVRLNQVTDLVPRSRDTQR